MKKNIIFLYSLMSLFVGYAVIGSDSREIEFTQFNVLKNEYSQVPSSDQTTTQSSLSMKEKLDAILDVSSYPDEFKSNEFKSMLKSRCCRELINVLLCGFGFYISRTYPDIYDYKIHNISDQLIYLHYRPGCKKAMVDSKKNNHTSLVDVDCLVEVQPHQSAIITTTRNKFDKICATHNPHVFDEDSFNQDFQCATPVWTGLGFMNSIKVINGHFCVHENLSFVRCDKYENSNATSDAQSFDYDEFVKNVTTYQPNSNHTWSTFNISESESKELN